MASGREAIDAVLDKDTSVKVARQQGVPIPETIDVDSPAELRSAARQLGYPVVLKRLSQQEIIPSAIADFTAEIVQDEQRLAEITDRLTEHGVVPQIQ
jgi:carbamoylphosphate synthase large subunit